MRKLVQIVLIPFLLSGCVSYLEIDEGTEWVIVKQTETPYERYLRHYSRFEEILGTCRFCSGETIDFEIKTCEECYYRVHKIKKRQIKVDPLQFNEPVYFKPQYVSFIKEKEEAKSNF